MLHLFCHYLRGNNEDNAFTTTTNTSTSLAQKFVTFKKFFIHITLILKLIFPNLLCTSSFLLAFLMIDVVGLEFIVYQVGLLGGKFYKSLTDKNLNEFKNLAFLAIGLIIVDALMVSLRDFVAQLMGIVWRKYITVKLHAVYFSNKNFYYLQQPTFLRKSNSDTNPNFQSSNDPVFNNPESKSILIDDGLVPNTVIRSSATQRTNFDDSFKSESKLDNPDQRITQDVNTLCKSFSTILPLILISPFVIAWYTYQLFKNVGYTGPLAVFVYFIIWSMINGPLTSPIVKVVYNQDRKEGDFRFKHMNLRTNAESIAFYDSSQNELFSMNQHFDKLLSVSYRRNWKELILKFFVNTSQYMGGIIAYLVLGIPIFTNMCDGLTPAELAQFISNYSFKCQYLIYLFTRLYNTLDEISSIAGNSHRVGELFDNMNKNSEKINDLSQELIIPNHNVELPSERDVQNLPANVCFLAEALNIYVPDRSKMLIKNLSFTFTSGRNVLVTGRSGCGKTSLFRCLNGLWSSYTGKLILSKSPENALFFLPQSSYFTSGSLLEQIIYPTIEESFLRQISKDSLEIFKLQIKSWLRKFNLEHLLQRVGLDLSVKPNFNWSSILSAGEQQRLSFLRVMFHRPKFVLLDEFTSSVDQDTEAIMYESLFEIETTFLSIAHRDTVRKYHHVEIKIRNDSECEINEI